ncbi:MAG TPA: hypothetical protein VLZ10_07110 [Thermodesulfobacteriota bacterium]|nr:hypothetical protein [Thermodesulfobacteriota bacterium]
MLSGFSALGKRKKCVAPVDAGSAVRKMGRNRRNHNKIQFTRLTELNGYPWGRWYRLAPGASISHLDRPVEFIIEIDTAPQNQRNSCMPINGNIPGGLFPNTIECFVPIG